MSVSAAYKAGALEKTETLCTKATKESKVMMQTFFLSREQIMLLETIKALPYAQKLEQLYFYLMITHYHTIF